MREHMAPPTSASTCHAKQGVRTVATQADSPVPWLPPTCRQTPRLECSTPVSMPMTTKRHLSPAKSSLYFSSLTRLAAINTALLVCPAEVVALRTVMSTANCAPWWRGKPDANTSLVLSSFAETATFMSRSFALNRMDAPASRQMRTKEGSGPAP